MNRKIKLFTLLIVTVLSTNILKAQTTTEEITTEFFKTYEKSPQKAVDYVFETNKWMIDRNKDGIENVKTQLTSFLGLVGDYYGYEKVTEKSVGESYKLVSYMIKYDRQPVRFTFVFYKPKDKWQVQNFQYDDNLDDELEESGKVYRLKENWE
ncbi:hypothetical protein [Winogradskyella sediminis]|uniref:DUF4878 domain-containing protein n=1 Tax=Winogradskyella sediminis TaxID=1382466 RepID=A0A1H1LYT6_9FLAO|nr:hypothetical protein [Winogradskyella sediminis]SDR79392.1 hypothetical protein SAMN04489797_0140 [Winogradskyella sediminis]